jgi:dipeptidyl-peptidase-4
MKKYILPLLCVCAFSAQAQKTVTLEDIWTKNTFAAKRIDAIRSANDGEHYFVLENNRAIAKYNLTTGQKVSELLNLSAIPNVRIEKIDNYQMNANEKKVLLTTQTKQIYRRSFEAEFMSYDFETKTVQPISTNGKQRLATFSPNSQYVAFVQNNNLFYVDLQTGKEVQITTDGKPNHIINGTTDWVYEEEFYITQGFCWSPAGDKIAYLRFDESDVREFSMTMWEGQLYPTEYRFKYPKAGEDNSLVTLHVYDLKNAKTVAIPLSQYSDYYIPRFGWTTNNNEIFFMVLNRHQNRLDLNIYNTQTQDIQTIYQETNKAFISVPELIFTADKFIITSEKEGYNQIYEYAKNGQGIKKLTPENYGVTAVYGLDEKNKRLYFQAAKSSPMNREICWVIVDNKTPKTTVVSAEQGTNQAVFSKTYKYFVNTHSSTSTAQKYTLHNANGKQLKVLEDNAELNQKFKDYNFVEKTFGTIKNAVGDDMPYWIMRPKNLEPGKKYPLLMFQYSGPGSQQVTNSASRQNDFWYQMLVAEGYIVVCVDGRGTGGKGEAYKKTTYLQLGKYETEDQIFAAKYFGSLDFIDASRIGNWGWSYGGFISSLCLFKGNDVFKMAIAVAPVGSWRYYDNIYTERYMRKPSENPEGYDDNSPINFVENLKGEYLLVHGTADDNVHFQNAVELVTALNNAGKHYDFYMYPDNNHGIGGAKARLHLYQKMTNFIHKNL